MLKELCDEIEKRQNDVEIRIGKIFHEYEVKIAYVRLLLSENYMHNLPYGLYSRSIVLFLIWKRRCLT